MGYKWKRDFMGYDNNVTFAIRTLLVYQRQKDTPLYKEYKFTMVAGALLNVLSAVLQKNNKCCINIKHLKEQRWPELHEYNAREIRRYFRQIRDALSLKTNDNFICEKEDAAIAKIKLRTERDNEPIFFSYGELQLLLDSLENAIQSQYPDLR
jgi:hypothetical protein